jgi:Short repeat of unknown function (DUF308)
MSEGRYRQRLSTFAANWRVMALRGLIALLFGLVVLFWPGLILAVLTLLFGFYALVDGGGRTRACSQKLRARRAKVASFGRGSGGCHRRALSPSLARDDRKRAALRHRGVGCCEWHTQDNHHNRAAQRGRKWVVACRKRRAVCALRGDPGGPGGFRSAFSSAIHQCFRDSGRPGADRLRLSDA